MNRRYSHHPDEHEFVTVRQFIAEAIVLAIGVVALFAIVVMVATSGGYR